MYFRKRKLFFFLTEYFLSVRLFESELDCRVQEISPLKLGQHGEALKIIYQHYDHDHDTSMI